MSCDAYHISAPDPKGEGAFMCIETALKDAGVDSTEVQYINAHGTSTPFNDRNESQAIMEVFGEYSEEVSVSSTKSMTGHLLGASGGIEAIASILALSDSVVPPTINYEDPDPECPLNYTPNQAVNKTLNYVMSNSFGFGGHNASLVFKKY